MDAVLSVQGASAPVKKKSFFSKFTRLNMLRLARAVIPAAAAKKLVDLIGADYIVSVGRGISKDVEGGIKLAEELADVLGGVVGGSRATIDSGWLSADHQVCLLYTSRCV